jgi:hypothetical protein
MNVKKLATGGGAGSSVKVMGAVAPLIAPRPTCKY